MEYEEQIKSPKWQKRRLEILQRDNFTCQLCGDKERTLHVHHLYYEPGKKIWEYPDSALITLCEECHKEEHMEKGEFSIDGVVKELEKMGVTHREIRIFLENLKHSLKESPFIIQFFNRFGNMHECLHNLALRRIRCKKENDK